MRLNQIKLGYLATPYSRYPRGTHGAYIDACKVAAKLDVAGVPYYCPVAETHGVAVHGGLDPLDHEFWLTRDLIRANFCDVLIIAEMDGWQESSGIAVEAAHFKSTRKPILNINPETLEITKTWIP